LFEFIRLGRRFRPSVATGCHKLDRPSLVMCDFRASIIAVRRPVSHPECHGQLFIPLKKLRKYEGNKR
jgi:hypothetical protein